jgi:hypothetical protein
MMRPVLVLLVLAATACGRLPAPQAQPAPARQDIGEFLVTSGSGAVGWETAAVLGFECRLFEYDGGDDYAERFNGTLAELIAAGKRKGANAFINASLSTVDQDSLVPPRSADIVHLCGDYAVLR